MIFRLLSVIAVLAVLVYSKPLPDSAGIVPLQDGFAYGGIPYGSVSGQLSLFYGDYEPIVSTNKITENEIQLV